MTPLGLSPLLKITMKLSSAFSTLGLALLLGLLPATALAGPGHGESPAAATGTALPRFAATSDLFELVGVLDGQKIALYLDHAAAVDYLTREKETMISLGMGEGKKEEKK